MQPRRRFLTVLLASSCLSAVSLTTSAQEIGSATPAERPDAALQLQPPVNSTLQIRVARRPWLLEKLTGSSPAPSIKMNPPRPPAAIPDPPSMSRMIPEGDSGWVKRGRVTSRIPSYADLSKPAELSDTAANESPSAAKPTAEPKSNRPAPESDISSHPPSMAIPARSSRPTDEPSKKEKEVVSSTNLPGPTSTDVAGPTDAPKQDQAIDSTVTAKANTPASADSDSKTAAESSSHGQKSSQPKTDQEAETPLASESIKVRKLRIESDGTLTDSRDRAASEPKKEATAAKPKSPPQTTLPPPTSSISVGDDDLAPKLDYSGRVAEPIRLTNSVARIQNMMKQCLRYYYARPENANERSNWGMLHSIMVFGTDTKIRVGSKHYSAIAWIAGNNACRGQRLLTLEDNAIVARSGVGLQGHQAQMLAVFSLCDVPFNYPLYAEGEKFSVRDIAESEMLACRRGEELTFTLIGLSHYLDTDTVWLNADGETWSFERLIREELSQTIVGAACGGTHRLMGFAHALRKRRAEGKPITGQWKRAEIYTQDFINYAYRLQNRDGSMSTDWFEGREDNEDMDRKIQTTGHMVEWLLTVTPDSQLQDRRLVNAIRYLLSTMYNERGHDWKIGPKGHALRSLAMYYERVYKRGSAWQSNSVAMTENSSLR